MPAPLHCGAGWRVGRCEGAEEHFFAIAAHHQLLHPLVQKLLPLNKA
ncbi:MAG: hypothetical protein V4454_14815 [Pseudomonadota bacterium]